MLRLRKPETEFADLLLFRISEDPGLPSLKIATASPIVGEPVLMIAAGTSRGGRYSRYTKGSEPLDGFTWESDQTKRWGTNRVEGPPKFLRHRETNTMAFPLKFSRIEEPGGTRYEAAGALGDSGGAVFAHEAPRDPSSDWVLSGIIFSVTSRGDALERTTLYKDLTWVADLSYYRDEIMGHIRQYENGATGQADPTAEGPGGESDRLTLAAGLTALGFLGFLAWLRTRGARAPALIDR